MGKQGSSTVRPAISYHLLRRGGLRLPAEQAALIASFTTVWWSLSYSGGWVGKQGSSTVWLMFQSVLGNELLELNCSSLATACWACCRGDPWTPL